MTFGDQSRNLFKGREVDYGSCTLDNLTKMSTVIGLPCVIRAISELSKLNPERSILQFVPSFSFKYTWPLCCSYRRGTRTSRKDGWCCLSINNGKKPERIFPTVPRYSYETRGWWINQM